MARRDIKAGAAYVELYVRRSKFDRALRRVQQRVSEFGSDLMQTGSQLARFGAAASVPFIASTKIFADFDDAMRGVKAITQATAEEFEMLTARAKELGATTSFSATQVASLMTELGRAGFTPDQIDAMTASVMNLARATGTEAALASGIFAATIRQFNMEASDASRVADALTAAANKSFNTVESLGDALSYAGPVASDANMSLEETLAILGTLGNLGIQGSNAGTAIRRLLTLSAAESQKFQEVFGVVTKDAQGNARNLVDVLADVADATAELGTAERAQKFNEVFGLLGITAASAISKTTTNTRELLSALEDAEGVAARTAKEMDAGLGGSLRILWSSLEGVAIAIGEAIQGPLSRFVDWFSATLGKVNEFIQNNQRFVQGIALATAGVVAAGGALIALGAAIKVASLAILPFAAAWTAASGVVTTAISVMQAPLLPLYAAVGAVTVSLGLLGAAALALLRSTGDLGRMLQGVSGIFHGFGEIAKQALSGIADALESGNMQLAARIMWAGLETAFYRGSLELLDIVVNFSDNAIETFRRMSVKIVQGMVKLSKRLPSLLATSLAGGDISSSIMGMFDNVIVDTTNALASRLAESTRELDALRAYAARLAQRRQSSGQPGQGSQPGPSPMPRPPVQSPGQSSGQPLGLTEQQIAKQQRQQRMEADAQQLTESLRTPMEVFRDELSKLRVLSKRGLIDETTLRRGVFAARQDLEDQMERRREGRDGRNALGGQTTIAGFSAAAIQAQARGVSQSREDRVKTAVEKQTAVLAARFDRMIHQMVAMTLHHA